MKIGRLAPHHKSVVSNCCYSLRAATGCDEVTAMNASVTSFNIALAAVPAGVTVAANGLNNNANNNTRHYGWAGV